MRNPEERIGRLVGGCRIERALGAGAMGTVYLARRERDGLRVVVKFPEIDPNDAALAARFAREGQALLRVRAHPNVLRVLAVAPDPTDPCLITEFVEGSSLRGRLQRQGALAPLEAVRIARDLASGLQAVHAAGLLHRDVKPANVVLSAAGVPKLIDFGLAKDVFLSALTLPDQLLGTAPYLAPERWEGEGGPASDAFALGVVLYELLSARQPFSAPNLEELEAQIREGDYEPLAGHVGDLPVGLEAVLEQLLASEVSRRYQHLSEAEDDLQRVLHGAPVEGVGFELASGRRLALPPARRVIVGSDPGCGLRLDGAAGAGGAEGQQLQIRRRAGGFEVRDLAKQTQTLLNGAALEGPAPLRDGDRLEFGGGAVLEFRDPRSRSRPPPFLACAERLRVPEPLAEALLRRASPHAFALAIERLHADPAHEAWLARGLSELYGAETASAVATSRALAQERTRVWLEQALPAMTRQRGVSDWLKCWDSLRTRAPLQVGPPAFGPPLLLRVTSGEPAALDLPLGDQSLVLIGRDPKCHLRLSSRSCSRHHATLLRLHRRFLIRDEGRARTHVDGAPVELSYLNPGAHVRIGKVHLSLEALPSALPQAGGRVFVDGLTFEALLEARHPATCRALVELTAAAPPTWAAALALLARRGVALEPRDLEALRARWVERARQLVPEFLGGAQEEAWRAALERVRLPPQVTVAAVAGVP